MRLLWLLSLSLFSAPRNFHFHIMIHYLNNNNKKKRRTEQLFRFNIAWCSCCYYCCSMCASCSFCFLSTTGYIISCFKLYTFQRFSSQLDGTLNLSFFFVRFTGALKSHIYTHIKLCTSSKSNKTRTVNFDYLFSLQCYPCHPPLIHYHTLTHGAYSIQWL